MNDIDVEICVVCNTEICIDDFYDKCRECKQCNIKRVLKRTMILKMIYCKNVGINMHVLNNWMID